MLQGDRWRLVWWWVGSEVVNLVGGELSAWDDWSEILGACSNLGVQM